MISFLQYTDAVEFLIHSYPEFVSVGSFPCDSLQEKVCVFLAPIMENFCIKVQRMMGRMLLMYPIFCSSPDLFGQATF